MTGRRTITQARGDVTGDGIPDRVWLSGYQETEGGMWQGIQLRIQDGASCRETRLSLPEDTGYNPRLTLCPLTGRDRMDILTSVDSGGSGGTGYYTVFGWLNRGFRRLFETAAYNAAYQYDVTYADGYTVQVYSRANQAEYRLCLRNPEAIAGLYDQEGKLTTPRQGMADPLGLVVPLSLQGDGRWKLLAAQELSGLYHADRLGTMFNLLRWNGLRFALESQYLGLQGS